MIDLKTKNATEITSYFSDAVNSLSFHPKQIAEEQKESREMRELDIFWIKILSSQDYSTDLRNKASAQTAEQLAEIPFIREQMELVHNKKMAEAAEKLSQEHRTLQQTFSSLVFYHLALSCNEEESKMLFQHMDNYFYILPLI